MGKIRYGIKNCYYAPITAVTASGYSYGTPVALKGARALALEAQGESTEEYFDDILWFKADANSGYSGTLELAYLPDSFYEDILGEVEDANGVHFEGSDADVIEFALLFEFQFGGTGASEAKGARNALYRCTAGRPAINHNTKQKSISVDTVTVPITAMPRETDAVVKSRCESTQAPYNTWFNSVYEKATTGE